jgi:hypothetical protein
MNNKFKNYEDIYPLTIIQMRYGGKYVAFNMESDNSFIHDVQLGEEAMYCTKKYIEDNYSGHYGIGNTIWEALDDLISNQ